MAIDKGIAISCADLQQVGGIKHILLRDWAAGDVVTYNSSDNHAITSIVDTGGSTADWYLYEFKSQEANMSINATKENGSTAFECGLTFTLPRMETVNLMAKQYELPREFTGTINYYTDATPSATYSATTS